MPEAISIDALLRLQTKSAQRDLDNFAKQTKPIQLKVKFKETEIGTAIADITAKSISTKLKSSFKTIGDDLVTKLEDGFEKASKISVKGRGGGLLGGLTNIVTAPLQGLARGAFEGVGKEVSRKFGIGLSKGIENEISQFVGSSEFLGEKLVTKIVPDLGKTAIAKIRATSLGKQLAEAMQDLDINAARENLKLRFRDLLGDSDLLIEQEFNRSQKSKADLQKLGVAKSEVGKQLIAELKLQPETELKNTQVAKQIKVLEALIQKNAVRGVKLSKVKSPSIQVTKEMEQVVSFLEKAEKKLQELKKEEKTLFTPVAQEKLTRLGVNTKGIEGVSIVVDNITKRNKEVLNQFNAAETNVRKDIDFITNQIPVQQKKLAELQKLASVALAQDNIPVARAIAAKIVETKGKINFLKNKLQEITDNLRKINDKQASLVQAIQSDHEEKLVLSLQEQIHVLEKTTGISARELSKTIARGQRKTFEAVAKEAKKTATKTIKVLEQNIDRGSAVDSSGLRQRESDFSETVLGQLIKQKESLSRATQKILDEQRRLSSVDKRDEEAIRAVQFFVDERITRLSKVNQEIAKISANKVDLNKLGFLLERREKTRVNIDRYQTELKSLNDTQKDLQDQDAIQAVDFFLKQNIDNLERVDKSLADLNKNQALFKEFQQIKADRTIVNNAKIASSKIEKARSKVENIDVIGDLEFERLNNRLKRISITAEELRETTQKAVSPSNKSEISKIPFEATKPQKFVNDIAKEVERLSGAVFANIPRIKIDPNLPQDLTGAFNSLDNVIKLRPDTFENINQGNINDKIIEVISHELRHAMQFQLAEANGSIDRLIRSDQFLIKSTGDESQILSKSIELSARNAKGNLSKEQVKALEEDAYTFAFRHLEEIKRNIEKVQSSGLNKIQEELKDLLSQVTPPQLPKTPPISSRAFPDISNSDDLQKLLEKQVSASGLKEIVKRLGLGTDSPVKKVAIERIVNSYKQDALKVQELIGRLGDNIKLKSAKTGAGSSLGKIDDEPALKEAFKANRRILGEAFKQLENLSGEQREVLSKQVSDRAYLQIQAIDRVTREFKVAGKTAQSLSGTRSQFSAIYDFESIKQASSKLQSTLSTLGQVDSTDAIKTITEVEPKIKAFLASVRTLEKTDETEKVRQQLESQFKAIKTAKKLSLEAVEFDYKELLSNPSEYINLLKDSAIAKSKANIQETASKTAKDIGGKVSQAVETILENTREKLAESLQQIERAALPERQVKAALPAAKTGEIVKAGGGQLSTQTQVINTVSSLAIRAIADITATSKSAFEQAKALEKLVLDLNPLLKVAKTGIQTATPVIAGGALVSQSPEVATAAKFVAENLADVIQPLIAALRAGGANAVGDLVGQIPGVGGVSRAVIQGLLNNPAFNAQIAEGLANVTTVAGIGAGAIKGGQQVASKVSQSAFKALPESLQDRLTPESITAFDTLVAQRQKEINILAKDVQQNVKAITSTQDPAQSQKLLAGYKQVTQQIEELEKFSVKAGIETLKRTKDRLNQLRKVQQGLKADVTVERVIEGDSDNLKNIGELYSAGLSEGVTTNVNRVNQQGERLAEELLQGFRDRLGIRSPSVVMQTQMKSVVQGLVKGEAENRQRLRRIGENLSQELEKSFTPQLTLSDSLEIKDLERRRLLDLEARPTKTQLKLQKEFQKSIDEKRGLSTRSSIVAQIEQEKEKGRILAERRRSHFNLPPDSLADLGSAFGQDFGAKLSSQLADGLQIEVKVEAIKAITNQITQGIQAGINSDAAEIESAGKKIGNNLLTGFRDRLDIRSPAGEFIKDMKFVALGVAVGVEHHLKTAIKAGARLGDSLATGFAKSDIAQGKIADKAAKQVEKQVRKLERQNDRATRATTKRIEQNLRRANQVITNESRKLDSQDRKNEIENARRIAQAQTRVFKNQGIGESPLRLQETEQTTGLVNRIKTAIASIQNDLRNSGLNKANKEAEKVVLSSRDLLSNLKVTVTLGQDAGKKIRQSQRAIAALEREQAKIIKGIGKLKGQEKLAVKAAVARIQTQIENEQRQVAGLKAQRNEAKKLFPVYKQLTKLNQDLQTAIALQDIKGIRRLNREINRVHESLNQPPPSNNNGFLENLQNQLDGIGLTSDRIKKGFVGLGTLLAGGLLIGGFDDVIRDFSRSTFELSNRFEQLEAQINFATGSVEKGAIAFQFAQQEAQRLKVDIEEAVKGYASLAAATRNNDTLRGETDRIFKVINQASRVTGNTAQQTEAAFLAIQQQISGGTLQLEELRQLGESGGISGVFNIAQKALGAADGELKKLISTGTIAVNDFLPKFIDELDRVTRSGVSKALETTASKLQAVKNEFKLLQNEVGKSSRASTQFALDKIAEGLELVKNNLHIIIPVLQTTAALVGVAILPAALSLGKFLAGMAVKGLGQVISLLGITNANLTATNAQLILLANTSPRMAFLVATMQKLQVAMKLAAAAAKAFIVIQAATTLFDTYSRAAKAGNEVKNSTQGIKDAILDLDKALAKLRVRDDGLLPEELTKQIIERNQQAVRDSLNWYQKLVDTYKPKFLGITFEESALSRIQAETGDAIAANQQLLRKAANQIGLEDITDKPTEDLKEFATAIEFANQGLTSTLDKAINPNQAQALNQELKLNNEQLNKYNQELERRGALELNLARIVIKRDDTVQAATKAEIEAIAAIDQETLKSEDFKKDVELQKLRFTKTRIDKELEAERLAIQQIQELAANGKGIDPKTGKPRNAQELDEYEKVEKKIIELTRSSIDTRQSLLAKEVEQKLAEYDRYLERAEGRRQKAEELAITSEKERLIEIQRLLNDEVITVEDAEELKLKAKSQQLKANLDQEKKKLRELKKFKSSEVEAQEKADNDIKQSKAKILDLTLSLLEQEKTATEKTINAIAQSRDNVFSALEQRLNRLRQIQQSIAGLISDRASAEEKLADLQLAKLRQALELRKQLNSGDLDRNERRTILKQLHGLGVEGKTSELGLLDQIKDKEKEIADAKIANLLRQQALKQREFELEVQQLELATRKANIEAKKGQRDAQKDLISAETAIATAETQEEFDRANELYDIAKLSLSLANEEAIAEAARLKNLDTEIAKKQEILDFNQAIARAELSGTTSDQEFELEKERNTAREARNRRRADRGENVDLSRYLSRQEKINEEIEQARNRKREGFSEEDEAKLRAKLSREFNRSEARQEIGVKRSLRGNPGFTIEAPPEILELIRSGQPISVPAIQPFKSTAPLQTTTVGKTKGSLGDGEQVLKVLRNIETNFKQPTVYNVINDNQFTNVYDKSNTDSIPRLVRSEVVDMLNTFESEMNNR